MNRRMLTAAVLSASCLVAACGGGLINADELDDVGSQLEYTVLERTDSSGIRQPRTAVADDDSSWAELWRQHKSPMSVEPARPAVAFTRETVAGIFLGDGSACTRIVVDSVTVARVGFKAVARVDYRVVEAGPGDACIAVIAQPSLLLRIANPDRLRVEFNRLPSGTALRGLAIGQSTAIPSSDVRVEVLAVEDSRCPADVVCVTAGQALVRLRVTQGASTQTVTLSSDGEAVTAAGWRFSVLQVSPYPSRAPVSADQYRVDLDYRKV